MGLVFELIPTLGLVRVTLKSVSSNLGSRWAALPSLWCDSAVTLGSLLACEGGFGPLWGHFVAYGGCSRTLYGYLGVSLTWHWDTLGGSGITSG